MYYQKGYIDKYTHDLSNSIDRLISTKLSLDKIEVGEERTLILDDEEYKELQSLSNIFIDDTKPMGFHIKKAETH